MAGFRGGLQETGFVESRNVTFEWRWANGDYDRLPALAADLVHRQPSVIAAALLPAAHAAKSATATIPIVFISGSDPIETGLVTSLNRPTENVTGVSLFAVPLITKRLAVCLSTLDKSAERASISPKCTVPGLSWRRGERPALSAAVRRVLGASASLVTRCHPPNLK
jgi:putative ABC transport system substrate-binding protein